MLDIILNTSENEKIDISAMKLNVAECAAKVTDEKLYDKVRDELKSKSLVQLMGTKPEPAKIPATEHAQKLEVKS